MTTHIEFNTHIGDNKIFVEASFDGDGELEDYDVWLCDAEDPDGMPRMKLDLEGIWVRRFALVELGTAAQEIEREAMQKFHDEHGSNHPQSPLRKQGKW